MEYSRPNELRGAGGLQGTILRRAVRLSWKLVCRSVVRLSCLPGELFFATHSAIALRPEALAVFGRRDECSDHLGLLEVAAELVELTQPELVSRVARIGRVGRVASQVAEVLHQHERRAEFGRAQRVRVRDRAQRGDSPRRAA